MPKVYFIDVTNRDAVQASRINLSKLQKTMVNIYLGEMGIHQSEFAFPFAKNEQNYLRANLELREMGAMGSLILEGWCRAVVPDVAEAIITGVKDLNLSISTSDQMIMHKFRGKLDREAVIREMLSAVTYAKEQGVKTIGVNAEDASRTDLGYLIEFAQAAKGAGADRLRYCDTLGYETPTTIYERVKTLAEQVKIPIELHCHNDLGMAVANSVSGAKGAIDGGVDAYINTSVNGLGERAGQADLLSCILALKFARGVEEYEIGDPIDLKISAKLANYVSYAFKVPIPINQPGVGSNAFAHESGIHADGTLKDRRNYELYDYELLGLDLEALSPRGRVITTGEFGGLAGFEYVYSRLGITFTSKEEAGRILNLVRYASAHNQLPLTDDELRFIAKYPGQVTTILTVNPVEEFSSPLEQRTIQAFIEKVGREAEQFLGSEPGAIVALLPDGPSYARALHRHLVDRGKNVTLTSLHLEKGGLEEEKIEGRRVLLVDNDTHTGETCKKAKQKLLELKTKLKLKGEIPLAVLDDFAYKADFWVNRPKK
jgi:isopropylmalate/homocitrate/citramalate synthase